MATKAAGFWDYLIVTAANARQAAAYEAQIGLRRELGLLPQVGKCLVVADRDGVRIGSGGSTLQCLDEVLRLEGQEDLPAAILKRLRILIVHAGGDSRRLPAYSPCGKIFIPLPGDGPEETGFTLFDRLVPAFLALPAGRHGAGQIVVAAGDALIRFDPTGVRFDQLGITALGAAAEPADAARHGVLCPNPDGSVRVYLQKPDVRAQVEAGAIGADGRSVLDIGVMSLDGAAAAALLDTFDDAAARAAIEAHGIDLYREICCALGTRATVDHYVKTVRAGKSMVEEATLTRWFARLHGIPMYVQVLEECSFLHFGSTAQLISSGLELVQQDGGVSNSTARLEMNNDARGESLISGSEVWVEGCRVGAALRLERRSVVVGVDVIEPLDLPAGACLDISEGVSRAGDRVWFVRCCGVDDTFKRSMADGASFCGVSLEHWLKAVGVPWSSVWDDSTPEEQRSLWNARVFPGEREPGGFRRWLWMFDVGRATLAQKLNFISADRYSSAEIAVLADHESFHVRRATLRRQ